MTGNVGTILYMAPEILRNKVNQAQSTKVDVYSFGIIMYEVFFEEQPYQANAEQFESIIGLATQVMDDTRPTIPWKLLADAQDKEKRYLELMKTCWHGDPTKRPSFDEVFSELMTIAE